MLNEARESWKMALHKGNIRAEVWFNLGYVEELQGNFKQARLFYSKSM